MGRRTPAGLWIVWALALVALGCLEQRIRTTSTVVSSGERLGPAASSSLFPLVFLHHRESATDLAVALLGRCPMYEIGDEERVQIRDKRVTGLTIGLAAITLAGALFLYAVPDPDAEQDQTPTMVLLGIAGLTYALPAVQEETVVTELTSRPVYRVRERVVCMVRPMARAQVEVHGPGTELLEGETDENGQLTFDRTLARGVVIIVDGREAESTWWTE